MKYVAEYSLNIGAGRNVVRGNSNLLEVEDDAHVINHHITREISLNNEIFLKITKCYY